MLYTVNEPVCLVSQGVYCSELSSIWNFKFSFFEKPLYWIYFVGHIPTMIFIPLLIPTCLMVKKLINPTKII